MHASRYVIASILLISCARTSPMETTEPDPTGLCVDEGGDEITGTFARTCGGWGERCEVCGELQTCDNKTRTCSDTCGPRDLFCANPGDCPVKTCATVSCEDGRCTYRTSIVESGGCIFTVGDEVFGGVCDDCDCVPVP